MLEQMDTIFGGVNHVEKGGAALGVEEVHHARPGHIGALEVEDVTMEDIVPAQPVVPKSDSKA